MMIYRWTNSQGCALCRRLSFAVCFSRRFKRFRGKASSSVDFSPFHLLYQSSIRLLKQTAKENLRQRGLHIVAINTPINHHLIERNKHIQYETDSFIQFCSGFVCLQQQ